MASDTGKRPGDNNAIYIRTLIRAPGVTNTVYSRMLARALGRNKGGFASLNIVVRIRVKEICICVYKYVICLMI